MDLYKKHQPDVVFVDALMPEFDGFYGLEKIRENYSNTVVMVTGSIDEDQFRYLCHMFLELMQQEL